MEDPQAPGQRPGPRTGGPSSRRAPSSASASLGLLTAKGYREGHGEPEVRRKELFFPDLPPAFDGLRIAHLSDLHSGPLVRRDQLRLWAGHGRTGAPRPSAHHRRSGGRPAGRGGNRSSRLSATSGIHGDDSPSSGIMTISQDPPPLWAGDGRHRIHLPGEPTPGSITGGGSASLSSACRIPWLAMGDSGDFASDLAPCPRTQRSSCHGMAGALALVHRPSNWNLALEAGARLTLSGHTHGGQINLVPGVSSAYIQGRFNPAGSTTKAPTR